VPSSGAGRVVSTTCLPCSLREGPGPAAHRAPGHRTAGSAQQRCREGGQHHLPPLHPAGGAGASSPPGPRAQASAGACLQSMRTAPCRSHSTLRHARTSRPRHALATCPCGPRTAPAREGWVLGCGWGRRRAFSRGAHRRPCKSTTSVRRSGRLALLARPHLQMKPSPIRLVQRLP